MPSAQPFQVKRHAAVETSHTHYLDTQHTHYEIERTEIWVSNVCV